MDDDVGLEGGESQSTDSGEAAVVYEIDTGESAAAAAERPAAQAAPPALAPTMDPRDARIQSLEQQLAQFGAELTPWLAHLQQQRRTADDQPPFRLEELDTNGNLKPTDLARYLQWEMRQELGRMRAETHGVARATLSEQEARGQFTAAELGQGNDYDSLVNRYVAPLVQQNPAVEQLLRAATPDNPAAGRMILATIIAAIDQSGGDLVKGVKSVLQGLGAYKQGARDTGRAISRAAQVANAHVLPGGAGAAGTQATKKLETYDDVWKLSDKAFDREWDRWGRQAGA